MLSSPLALATSILPHCPFLPTTPLKITCQNAVAAKSNSVSQFHRNRGTKDTPLQCTLISRKRTPKTNDSIKGSPAIC